MTTEEHFIEIESFNILNIKKIKYFQTQRSGHISNKYELIITDEKDVIHRMKVPDSSTALICLQIINISIFNNNLSDKFTK